MLLAHKCLCVGGNGDLLSMQIETDLQTRQGRQRDPLVGVIRGAKPQFFEVAVVHPQRISHYPAGPQIPTRVVVHGDCQPLQGIGGGFSPS